MAEPVAVRPVEGRDFAGWQTLWDGYNAFYGREGDTALPASVTEITWRRFFDPGEPVFAHVAEDGETLLGIVHYLFHRSTTRIEPVCYLQDLFTLPSARGRGIGRRLIQSVYQAAQSHGARRVYWQTQASNATARALYDQMAAHAGFIVYAHDIDAG